MLVELELASRPEHG